MLISRLDDHGKHLAVDSYKFEFIFSNIYELKLVTKN